MFQQNRVPYTVALEVGGWEVIKQYVAMGLGISIVTAICLTEADRERLAARSLARVFPVAQLRRGGAQGQVFVAAGAGIYRTDKAGAVRARRLLLDRPIRALTFKPRSAASAARERHQASWFLPLTRCGTSRGCG